MSDEFQFPAFHATEIAEGEDGELYESALTPPVCDFCFDVRVTWDYETDKFYMDEIEFASDCGWAVCEPCARLVEARLLPELTARMLRSWKALKGREASTDELDRAGLIVQGFFDHLRPGRVPFG